MLLAGAAALFWYTLFGDESARNDQALALLRHAGYVTDESRELFVSDTHGGFHGDGDTLVTFVCAAACLENLRARALDDYAPQLPLGTATGWSPLGEASTAEIHRTIDYILSGPTERRLHVPDLENRNLVYLCGGKGQPPAGYCAELFVLDRAAGRFWYLEIQT